MKTSRQAYISRYSDITQQDDDSEDKSVISL